MSALIHVEDVKLPPGYDFRQAEEVSEYTCRVCDGDVYDETLSTGLEYFLP